MSQKKTKTEFQKYKSIFKKLENKLEKEKAERAKKGEKGERNSKAV